MKAAAEQLVQESIETEKQVEGGLFDFAGEVVLVNNVKLRLGRVCYQTVELRRG
jgi:hypothetical protein